MGISLRKSEKSGVVTLSGSIGLDQLVVLNDYVDLLLTNRVTTIYIDFTGVPSLSVSAVGALNSIRDRVDEHGGRLMLAGLQGGLNPLIDLDHLRRFFTVFDGPLPVEKDPDADEAKTGVEAVVPGPAAASDEDFSGQMTAEAD